MTTISKQEYAKTIDTYISSKIDVFESPNSPDKFEWAFIEGMPKVECVMPEPAGGDKVMGLQPDFTRYKTRAEAMTRAINAVKEEFHCALKIAKNDTKEWMKYNKHTLEK